MKPKQFRTLAWTRARAALAAVLAAALLPSCAHLNPPEPEPEPTVVQKKPPPEPTKPPPPSPLYEWWGGNEYLSRIEVDVDEQKARFYAGDELVGWTTVASGIHKFPTPIGDFAVTEKVRNKESNLYGKIYNKNGKLVRRSAKMGVHPIPAGGRFKGAPMPFFLRLTNDGIGMHAGPIPRPGRRASHGCIRMPRNFAPVLYHHVDIGTPVTIKGNGPTYASYAANQRKSAPKTRKTAVAEDTTAPLSASSGVSAIKPGSPSAQPITVPAAPTATAPAGPPAQPTVSGTAATPTTPAAVAPPSPSMVADDPTHTSAYEAHSTPVPATTPAPAALGATDSGTANPPLYTAPLMPRPEPPNPNVPSASKAPLSSPTPSTDTQAPPSPATGAPVPEVPRTPPSERSAGTTRVATPSAPIQSSATQAPVPAILDKD